MKSRYVSKLKEMSFMPSSLEVTVIVLSIIIILNIVFFIIIILLFYKFLHNQQDYIKHIDIQLEEIINRI
jgi:hypothetical protein